MKRFKPDDELASELAPELGLRAARQVKSGFNLPFVPAPDEIAALLHAPDNERDSLLLRVLYATGVWLEEACALRFEHLSKPQETVVVHPGKRTDRVVFADAETFDQLAAWRRHRRTSKSDLVFEGTPEKQLQSAIVRWGAAVGLVDTFAGMGRHFTAQTLRHAFGSHNIEGGMDVFVLKRLMGHVWLETTEMYMGTAMRVFRDQYMEFHPLAGGGRRAGG